MHIAEGKGHETVCGYLDNALCGGGRSTFTCLAPARLCLFRAPSLTWVEANQVVHLVVDVAVVTLRYVQVVRGVAAEEQVLLNPL